MIQIYKGYQIKPHPLIPTSYICVTDGKGGKIPDSLTGVFTSPSRIKFIIDNYTPKRGKSNAKTRNESRS